VLLGLSPIVGTVGLCLGAGLLIGVGGASLDESDAVVGVTLTAALGLGVLFISLYSGYANATYSILFGQILGVTWDDVGLVAALSLGVLLVVSLSYRPLLFASVDAQSAAARGLFDSRDVAALHGVAGDHDRGRHSDSSACCSCFRCSSHRPRPPKC